MDVVSASGVGSSPNFWLGVGIVRIHGLLVLRLVGNFRTHRRTCWQSLWCCAGVWRPAFGFRLWARCVCVRMGCERIRSGLQALLEQRMLFVSRGAIVLRHRVFLVGAGPLVKNAWGANLTTSFPVIDLPLR